MMLRHILAGAWAVLCLCSSIAHAADALHAIDQPQPLLPYQHKPAVSAFNGKFEAAYVWSRLDGAGSSDGLQAAGAVSFPLGHSFGLQIDGGLARVSGGTAGGIGAHLFWRRPETALVGVYADFQRNGGQDYSTWRLAAEGELYFGRFSLEGLAGAETVRADNFRETYFTGEAIAAFYVTDNIRIHGGVGHRFDETFGRIGAEAILPFAANNVALYTDGTFSSDATTIRAGLRVYFGQRGKALIDRHREDDPKIRLFDGAPPLESAGAGSTGGSGPPQPSEIPPNGPAENDDPPTGEPDVVTDPTPPSTDPDQTGEIPDETDNEGTGSNLPPDPESPQNPPSSEYVQCMLILGDHDECARM